jgi:hypothetical protein
MPLPVRKQRAVAGNSVASGWPITDTMKTSKQLIQESFEATAAWLLAYDYGIRNESELCNVFFHHLMTTFIQAGRAPACVRAEFKLLKKVGYRTRVEASVDFAIICDRANEGCLDAMIEAKSWIRPTHIKGAMTPNSSTSKRSQCIADAKRLLQLAQRGLTQDSALLIYERSSTHLRRLVPKILSTVSIDASASWIDIGRPALGRRKEHIGLLWLKSAPHRLNMPLEQTAADIVGSPEITALPAGPAA